MQHTSDVHDVQAHGAHAQGHGGRQPRSFAEKFVIPLAIPLAAVVMGGAAIFFISQILLAARDAAPPIALLIALVILLTGAFFASAPRLSRTQIAAGIAVPAIVLAAAGIGSGLYSLNHKAGPATEAALPPPAPEITTDNQFSVTAYKVPAGQPVTIHVQNNGQATHNFDIIGQKDASGNDLKTALLAPGQSADLTFTLPAGTYNFQCDVHPTEMKGTITVK